MTRPYEDFSISDLYACRKGLQRIIAGGSIISISLLFSSRLYFVLDPLKQIGIVLLMFFSVPMVMGCWSLRVGIRNLEPDFPGLGRLFIAGVIPIALVFASLVAGPISGAYRNLFSVAIAVAMGGFFWNVLGLSQRISAGLEVRHYGAYLRIGRVVVAVWLFVQIGLALIRPDLNAEAGNVLLTIFGMVPTIAVFGPMGCLGQQLHILAIRRERAARDADENPDARVSPFHPDTDDLRTIGKGFGSIMGAVMMVGMPFILAPIGRRGKLDWGDAFPIVCFAIVFGQLIVGSLHLRSVYANAIFLIYSAVLFGAAAGAKFCMDAGFLQLPGLVEKSAACAMIAAAVVIQCVALAITSDIGRMLDIGYSSRTIRGAQATSVCCALFSAYRILVADPNSGEELLFMFPMMIGAFAVFIVMQPLQKPLQSAALTAAARMDDDR